MINSRCASFKTKWRCCAVKPSCGVEVAVCGRNHMGPKTNIAKHSSRPQASTQWVRCDPLIICLRFRDVLFSAESVVSSQGWFLSTPFDEEFFLVLLSASTELISWMVQFVYHLGRKLQCILYSKMVILMKFGLEASICYKMQMSELVLFCVCASALSGPISVLCRTTFGGECQKVKN